VFPTFDQRTLAGLIQDELQPTKGNARTQLPSAARSMPETSCWRSTRDIRPPSITTDGARSILQRLSETAVEVDIDHPKHDYLAPHGGRRGMGEVLVRAFGYTVAARYLDNLRRWFGSATRILKLVNSVMSQPKHCKQID